VTTSIRYADSEPGWAIDASAFILKTNVSCTLQGEIAGPHKLVKSPVYDSVECYRNNLSGLEIRTSPLKAYLISRNRPLLTS
jgi:hypothetical protein